jgi:hypothetical protein
MSAPATRPLEEWIKVGGSVTSKNYKTIKYSIKRDAPCALLSQWDQFYSDVVEYGSVRDAIMMEWTQECTLAQNKTLTLLQRCEACLGGDANQLDKQVRGRFGYSSTDAFKDGEIGFYLINAYLEHGEKWSRGEAEDLRSAFFRVLLQHMH